MISAFVKAYPKNSHSMEAKDENSRALFKVIPDFCGAVHENGDAV